MNLLFLYCLYSSIFLQTMTVGRRRLHSEILAETSEAYEGEYSQGHRRVLSEDVMIKREDHLVQDLPGFNASHFNIGKQYAGHINVDPQNNGNLFYWLFESPSKSDELPLMIWINGGPGCSSMDGLWLELGPLRLDGDRVKINPFSWHLEANLLFIDQPVGTGLSYVTKREGICKDDPCINKHFYTFLVKFFQLHPTYVSTVKSDNGRERKTTRPFFITGESHAGHYIPNIALHISNQNRIAENELYISLQGIALGNPWIFRVWDTTVDGCMKGPNATYEEY